MRPTFRPFLPALLALTLAACGIDAGDMNGSGYRALAFELPDEATKYFDAARDLIAEDTSGGDPTVHPEYARMRVGEILVEAWADGPAAFEHLRAEVERIPDLLNVRRAELLIDLYAKREDLARALAIAEFAVTQFPGEDRLATKRDNLRGRIDPQTPLVAPLAGPSGAPGGGNG